MAFRLIYEGELLSRQAGDKTAVRKNKHEIRKQLHPQLKQLWETDHRLRDIAYSPPRDVQSSSGVPLATIDVIAKKYERCGNGFVPLIESQDPRILGHRYASLDILFLRREPPGAIVRGGDIDNRIKTLFDALQVPEECSEITEPLEPDEKPMYCLLAPGQDQLISEVRITTDVLLKSARGSSPHDLNQVTLVVQVDVRYYGETWYVVASV